MASSLGNEYAARTYGFGPDTVEKQVPGTNKTEIMLHFSESETSLQVVKVRNGF